MGVGGCGWVWVGVGGWVGGWVGGVCGCVGVWALKMLVQGHLNFIVVLVRLDCSKWCIHDYTRVQCCSSGKW